MLPTPTGDYGASLRSPWPAATDAGPANKNGGNPTDRGHCAHRRPHHRSRSGAADSQPHGQAPRAAPHRPARGPPRVGRAARRCRTRLGPPWPNRSPTTSSTSRCRASRLPSPGRAGDAPLPAPAVIAPRQTHAKPRPASFAQHPPQPRFAPRIPPVPPVGSSCALAEPGPSMLVSLTTATVGLDFLSPLSPNWRP